MSQSYLYSSIFPLEKDNKKGGAKNAILELIRVSKHYISSSIFPLERDNQASYVFNDGGGGGQNKWEKRVCKKLLYGCLKYLYSSIFPLEGQLFFIHFQ